MVSSFMRKNILSLLIMTGAWVSLSAQSASDLDQFKQIILMEAEDEQPDSTAVIETVETEYLPSDSVWTTNIDGDSVLVRKVSMIPEGMYQFPVFDGWHSYDSLSLTSKKRDPLFESSFRWVDDLADGFLILNRARREFIVNNPDLVKYNIDILPVRPEDYNMTVGSTAEKIVLQAPGVPIKKENVSEVAPEINRLKWLQEFNGAVQFSQAYVSPNWYQGGNNSLIMLVNALYKVKLNQKFYPKLLFETTVGYKLGVNTVPDDSIHNYSISEDLFQVNSTFGYKAAKKWYYTVNLQFKTQFLNSYNTNSTTLRSAFLSPAELNIGAGMTYDYTNTKGTFAFKASIDPISWQLMACVNKKVNGVGFDIPEGKRWTQKSGSSFGYNMTWKINYNITYTSRLFLFTNYSLFQADWEHKLAFNINKYLSTNIYVNMRYDTDTPRIEGSKWSKFQMKEILSFGFSYTIDNTRP